MHRNDTFYHSSSGLPKKNWTISTNLDRFVIRQNLIDSDDDRCPLNLLLLDGFQLAAMFMLGSGTLVIIMLGSGSTGSAFSSKHPPAFAAEELCCQKILFIRLCFRGSMPVALHALLNTFKLVFFDDNRQFVRNADRSVVILAQILPVFQYGSKARNSERFSRCCQQSSAVQGINDILHQFPVVITLEDLFYNRRGFRINLQQSISARPISQSNLTAIILTLQGVFHLSALDFLRQFC